jgi:hypothetical protein
VSDKKEHCPRRLVGEHQEPHMPCDTGDHSRDGVLQAAQSQISALKVELAAMTKERDDLRAGQQNDDRDYRKVIAERDAALMDLSQARAERDEAIRQRAIINEQRRQENGAAADDLIAMRNERDAALLELSQARGERDRLQEREKHFAKALAVADGGQYRADWDGAIARVIAERDAAVARAEVAETLLDAKRVLVSALREENARLKAEPGFLSKSMNDADFRERLAREMASDELTVTKELLGRAVAALQEAYDHTVEMRIVQAPENTDAEREAVYQTFRRIGRMLDDATATQAADAWRAQQEVVEAAKGFRGSGVPHERWVRLWDALDELARVDARRGGGR